MQLRTAYCLNALFQRRGSTRLLNTLYTRIDVHDGSALFQRMIVSTPAEAESHLRHILNTPHRLLPLSPGHKAIPPITFTVEGLIHEPFKSDRVVEALSIRFFDCTSSSSVSFDPTFLSGVIHWDALPDQAGPDIHAFITALGMAGDDWTAIDLLRDLAQRQAA